MMSKSKRVIGLLMVMILTVSMLAACGGKTSTSGSKEYEFTYKDQTVTIHSEAKKFLEKAGTPKETKKTASCAYDGFDRTYVFDDFTVYTYSKTKAGEEYINSITLTSDKVETKEKLKIGGSDKDMEKAYGTSKGKFGVFTYTKGKTKMVIELDDSNKVISIQYMEK